MDKVITLTMYDGLGMIVFRCLLDNKLFLMQVIVVELVIGSYQPFPLEITLSVGKVGWIVTEKSA